MYFDYPFNIKLNQTMKKDLTASNVDRQNILNNKPALIEIKKYIGIKSIIIEWEIRFTTKQVAEFYDVDEKTIKRYVDQYFDELHNNGYEVLTGERLKKAKEAYVEDINVPNLEKHAPSLGFFDFRAFLNIWMLLSESERAKQIRSVILNIVIEFLNKTGRWDTTYINQNDQTFLVAYRDSIYYRKRFTDALKTYIDSGNEKYPHFTEKVYEAIFMEKSKQYKLLLKLGSKDNLRHTFYTEVLAVVSSYENWFAHELQKKAKELDRSLTMFEAIELFNELKESPLLEPTKEMARTLMATRDNALRQIIHDKLTPYIQSLSETDYERFCDDYGEVIWWKIKEVVNLIDKHKDVFMRLKDK